MENRDLHFQGLPGIYRVHKRREDLEEHQAPIPGLLAVLVGRCLVGGDLLADKVDRASVHVHNVGAIEPSDNRELRTANQEGGREKFTERDRVVGIVRDTIEIEHEGLRLRR